MLLCGFSNIMYNKKCYLYAPKVMLNFLYEDMEQLAVPNDLL